MEVLMKKINLMSKVYNKFAAAAICVLTAVLFVCANTNSCCMVYQPEIPEGLEHFSKIQ